MFTLSHVSNFPLITTTFITVRLLQRRPLGQNWPIGLRENNLTFRSRNVVVDQSVARKEKNNKSLKAQNVNIDSNRFSRKHNVSPDNLFLFETLHLTPRRHICFTRAISSIPLPRFAITCDFK